MKCANCDQEAVFTFVNPATRPIHYCGSCLPSHLRTKAAEGHFPLITEEANVPPLLDDVVTLKRKPRKKPTADENI